MKKSTIAIRLSILTTLHFLVDFICVFCVCYNHLCFSELAIAPYTILVYDCIAFLTQPLFGMLVDKNYSKKQLNSGLFLVAILVIFGAALSYENTLLGLLFSHGGIFI